eukprot:gene53403-65413_t
MSRLAFVTGATGNVGNGQGWRVAALVRDEARAAAALPAAGRRADPGGGPWGTGKKRMREGQCPRTLPVRGAHRLAAGEAAAAD